jgi:hypothetical protein
MFIAGFCFAAMDPTTVENGHVYVFDSVDGDQLPDVGTMGNNGIVLGGPTLVASPNGKAMLFDGVDDGVHIPDSDAINTGGPFPNRTVIAMFNCADVTKADTKQTIFEEGGRTRGAVIYVHDSKLYVGAWNRAEYMWDGAWINTDVMSNTWYGVAFVIRDGGGEEVEPEKFEMWVNGRLIGKADGGQLHGHGDDNCIGATKQNVVFHDDEGSEGNYNWYFDGMIDELWILNEALSADDLGPITTPVEPREKLTTSWGAIKE